MSIEKEFVLYQEALELKELGFDEPCFGCFNHLDQSEIWTNRTYMNGLTENITAPTFSQAFRWFREKYDLPSNLELFHVGWDYVIYLNITEKIDFNEGPWNTYEEAELACLRKLIEIVQGGNK